MSLLHVARLCGSSQPLNSVTHLANPSLFVSAPTQTHTFSTSSLDYCNHFQISFTNPPAFSQFHLAHTSSWILLIFLVTDTCSTTSKCPHCNHVMLQPVSLTFMVLPGSLMISQSQALFFSLDPVSAWLNYIPHLEWPFHF